MKITKIFLCTLLLIALIGCESNKESANDETTEQNTQEVISDDQSSTPTNDEVFYLYQVCDNAKINDLLNNIPEMISIGGGYPKLLWGDSLFGDSVGLFSNSFVKLEVIKVDKCNTEDFTNTIEFYWDENDCYSIYYTDDYLTLINNQAYKIIDISPIDVDWWEE